MAKSKPGRTKGTKATPKDRSRKRVCAGSRSGGDRACLKPTGTRKAGIVRGAGQADRRRVRAAAAKSPARSRPKGDYRPARNAAGLKPKDLAMFRELLLAKRREILGDVHSMEQEALQAAGGANLSNLPIHMADMGTDNYEQEFTLGLVEKDRQLLREIDLALEKIRNGTYGICEGTGKPIGRARLEAQPWARYSIEYARQMEKGGHPQII